MKGTTVTLYRVASDSNASEYYEVKFYKDGHVKCDCPSSRFKAGGTSECKHIARLRRRGAGFDGGQTDVKVYNVTYQNNVNTVVGDKANNIVNRMVELLPVDGEVTVKRVV